MTTTLAQFLRATTLGILIILVGCAGPQTTEDPEVRLVEGPKQKQIEAEARPLYFQAEKAFNAKNYDVAQHLFQQLKTRFPKGRAQYYASYRLGIIFYYRENYVAATKEFENFVTHLPSSELAFDATYNWGAAEFQQAHFDPALQILARLKLSEIQAQGPRRAETVYQLAARCATAMGNRMAAVSTYALQLQLPLQDSVRSAVEQKVDEQLAKMNDRVQLDQLLTEVTEPEVKQKISARLAHLTPAKTEETANLPGPPSAVPQGEPVAAVELGSGSSGQRYNVGVVLPLSGKSAAYGKRALDGIMLAAKIFDPVGDSGLRLFIEDSASNPLIAQHAVDDLVHKKEVVAIIGPLGWKECVAVAEKAQSLGVLNISLTTKEGISEKGPYLFQNALTPRVQLESLVKYTIGEKKLKRFAILAPNNGFGKDMSRYFWDLVEQMGGRIVSSQFYPETEKDFQSFAQELVGLTNLKFRRFEIAKLQDFIKEQKLKTGKEPKTQLPGIVDFDAIFIPDNPKTVAQIAPSLYYFDVTGVSLLGTTEWNTDQLYKRGGRYVEGAIFPAGLNLNSTNAKTQEFIKGYLEAYGSYPDLLATQAFEAMQLVAYGIRSANSDDRNSIVNQLAHVRDFDTPLGNLAFDESRIAHRKLPILSLESGGHFTEH